MLSANAAVRRLTDLLLPAALAAVVAACGGGASPTPTVTAASPSAGAAATAPATETQAASATRAATAVATAAAASATPGGSAAEQAVRLAIETSGRHETAVAELRTDGTPEEGRRLVAALVDGALQTYQASDISVLPVGPPLAIADLAIAVTSITAYTGPPWPGAVWLASSADHDAHTVVGLLSWTRDDGWRGQISWTVYQPCELTPHISDLDGDGTPEIMLPNAGPAPAAAAPLCAPPSPELFRWTGGAMTQVRATTLPPGAPGATANNAAVADALSGAWETADDEIAAARAAAPADPIVRWNAALIAGALGYRASERELTEHALAVASDGDFATALRFSYQSSVAIADVISLHEATRILAHASAGEPAMSTPEAAFAAFAELTFRVAAREALADTPDADPAALAADRDALDRARTAVFGEASAVATPTPAS